MTGRRVRRIVPALALALAACVVVAWAFWSATGAGTASAASGSLAEAAISVPANATGSVTVTWSQQASLVPSSAENSAITYSVERKLDAGPYAAVTSGGCSGAKPHGTTSCVDTPPGNGSYTYRVVATYQTWTATSSEAGPVAFTIDVTGPSGGSVDASGLVGTGGRYSTSTALSIDLSKGTDPSGLATSGAQLRRSTATLTSGGVANGSCGSYSASVQIGADDPVSPVADTVPAGQACYRYEYVVADTLGNSTTYTSPDIKIDTTAPAAPTLAFSAFTNTYWNGSTLFYRSDATSGAFTVTADSTDANSGIASYAFPTLPAGWTATAGALGVNTYSWSAPNPTAPSGAQNTTATNNATLTSAAAGFTLTSDITAPATGTVTYTNGYYSSPSVSVSFTKGTDAGSGVNLTSGLLQRASATLLAGGTCGSYGAFATVTGGTNPTSPFTDSSVAAGNCYQYRYLVSDNVGNQATYTSASVAKIDTTAPTIARAVAAKTDGSTPGTIRQGGAYYVYAEVTDNASVSTVTTNTSSFDTGVTAASLSATGGPWTVGGLSYNYRSATLTANTPLNTGSSYSYSVSAADGAGNSASPFSGSATIETYDSVMANTSGLVSHWRLGDGAISADELDDSSGTVLSSHTGELSATWTGMSGEARTALITNENRLRKETGNGAAFYYASATPSSAAYLVEADVHVKSLLATDAIGVAGRLNTATDTYYLARYLVDSGAWQLLRVSGGSATTLGSFTQALSAGQTYRLTLEMSGSTIRLLVGGIQRISATDANISATGRGGVRLGTGASTAQVTNTAGLHLDNFRITSLSTTAADSNGTNTGTYTNGVRLNQPGALFGDTDRAGIFDGSDDHVNVPDAASLDLGNGPLTLEAWIKRSAINVDGAIVYKWAAYTLGMSGTTANRLTFRKPGTADIVSSTIAISDTTSWHHVVATKNGTTSRLYIDGNDVTGTVTDQTLVNTVDPLQISGSPRFAGHIDEVAIYNSALSAATVLDHYKAGSGTG